MLGTPTLRHGKRPWMWPHAWSAWKGPYKLTVQLILFYLDKINDTWINGKTRDYKRENKRLLKMLLRIRRGINTDPDHSNPDPNLGSQIERDPGIFTRTSKYSLCFDNRLETIWVLQLRRNKSILIGLDQVSLLNCIISPSETESGTAFPMRNRIWKRQIS